MNGFSKKLLRWHGSNPRGMPWKDTTDPYKIWLSEIILQQTRVEQGLPYYERMIRQFPTVHHLAKASEDEVLKSWEGLGYYSRARNLHEASRQIVNDHEGKFPVSYETILNLKGVGVYTAAAIASFAYNLPHAVVDGNVFRVLGRYFGIREAVDSASGKLTFTKLAEKLLDKKNPAEYNQAIMNFGALVCKPAKPDCDSCIFSKSCVAFQSNAVFDFPVKEKKKKVRTRWFNYLVIENETEIIIEKRAANDIWKGLYQFPLIETKTYDSPDNFLKGWEHAVVFSGRKMKIKGVSKVLEHKLTHQTIFAQFIRVQLPAIRKALPANWMILKKKALEDAGFPILIRNYLRAFTSSENSIMN